MRSVVVLPQPLGPSSVKNSPSRISRFRRSTAGTAPKRFVRFSMRRKLIPLLGANADFEAERAGDERDAERQSHDEDDRDTCDLTVAGEDLIERQQDKRPRLRSREQDNARGVLRREHELD